MSSRKSSSLDRLLRDKPDNVALAHAAEAPRSVSFTLDPTDIRLAETRWITSEILTHSLRGWLFMISLLILIALFPLILMNAQLTLDIAIGIASMALMLAVVALQENAIKKRMVNTPGLREETTVAIDPDGVVEATSTGSVRYPWASVRQAIVDERQIYIRINGVYREQIEHEILIPRRAFLGTGHLEGFLVMISAYRSGMIIEREAAWPPKPSM